LKKIVPRFMTIDGSKLKYAGVEAHLKDNKKCKSIQLKGATITAERVIGPKYWISIKNGKIMRRVACQSHANREKWVNLLNAASDGQD